MDKQEKNLKEEIYALRSFFKHHEMRSKAHEHRIVFEETAYMFQSNMHMGMWFFSLLTLFFVVLSSVFKSVEWFEWSALALMVLSFICGILFLVFLNPTPAKNNFLSKCKLFFSPWTVKDVERAIENRDFKHPSIRKIDKNLAKLQPLSAQDLEGHDHVFSNLPSDDECFQIWSKLFKSPDGSFVRQIDVENLHLLHQKIKELSLLNPVIQQTVTIENPSNENEMDEKLEERVNCAVDAVLKHKK